MLISLDILLVANLVSQRILQNSANLGKKADSNTEGIHNSKKLVNSTGEIGTLAVKVTVLFLLLEVWTTASISTTTLPLIRTF